MKLVRFGPKGSERPGVVDSDGNVRDVSTFTHEFDGAFFGDDGPRRLREWFDDHLEGCPLVDADTRLGAPIATPSKIVCVGANYAKHAAESGMDVPTEPVLFFKAPSSITGPFDDIIIPMNAEKTDWEVEMALVIGRRAAYVEQEQAMDYVAGYMVHNDVSERSFQLERGGQWVKGKSADTFAPIGPYLVTPDEVGDPHHLDLWLKVNDEVMQSSSTSDFVFDVPVLVSYISQFMSLQPGDMISTGTPFGVGLGLTPPRYLEPGDVVELGVEKLGTARQHVRAWQT